ncbi:S8 family peptidase [Pseudobacteroides cellulosolvens]|uniref:Thermitase n=1 Tax=Pseudobacteroides cellulosolvens ATCC 35603 = DSM 2933 TaxID=398512 RepID=A0A0L6JK76_9FIRM|nr:S8 family peptidase [Pseudobacteroides cellulosolvens]KNY26165.1 Thermitase [Pseudobacteroides cellulosolvens ATCC 35603 = DSM 2933]
MSKKIISLLTMVCVVFTTFSFNVFAQNEPDQSSKESLKSMNINENNQRKPGQLIVKYKNNSSSRANAKTIADNEGKILKSNPNGLTLIEVDDKKISKKMKDLKKNKNIEYVVPNYTRQAVEFPSDLPNDPEFKNQWGLQNINAQQAWVKLAETSSLKEVKVAVIDTGLDMQHEDLKDKISPDGYDFVDMDNDPTYGPVNEDHASHVAGIIAATTDNKLGVSGTSGKAPIKIMPLRVLNAGFGEDFNIAQAITYAADHGVKVINMSLGGAMESPVLTEAVNYALSKNVVVVAAAGNNSMDAANFYPAAIPGVVTVSATDINNSFASFSNYGSVVELAAPGVDVLSTITKNKYEYFDGTSMSAPFVSAACALLLSRNPSLSNIEVEQFLTDSAKDIGSVGKDESFGYGLLDLAKALTITEVKPRLEIMNLSDNSTVFDLINVQTRFTYPQNIVKTDLFIDESVIQSVYNGPSNNESVVQSVYSTPIKMFDNFEIDTNMFNDGIHNLKVVACDKSGQSYSKEIKINIRNNIYTGLRVKLTNDGEPVNGGFIEVWNKYTDSDGKTYFGYVYTGRTSKTGVAIIPGAAAPNGNEYVIAANYPIPDGDGYINASLIKEAVAPGMIEMDGKDLVPVTVDTGLDTDSQAVFASYKLPGSNHIFQTLVSQTSTSGEFEFYLSPGTYSFQATTFGINSEDGTKEPVYFLNSGDVEIDSENFFVTMDSDIENLAKIDLSYKNMHGFIPLEAYMSIGSEDSTFSNSIFLNDFKGITEIYVTPGNYSYNFDLLGEKDGKKAYASFEGNSMEFEAESENDISFGGILTGNIETSKSKYIPGEEVFIDASVTDSQENKLLFMEYIRDDLFENLIGQNVISYKRGINKVGFKAADTITKALEEPEEPVEPDKPVEIEYKSPANLELLDSKNNVIMNMPQGSFDYMNLQLPQNLDTGNYKLKMILDIPYLIQAETALSVSRLIKKNAVKFNIELPGNEKATSATIEAINSTTGASYAYYGENLLNGEMYAALPAGTYKFVISTNTSDGKPVIYIKDAKSPSEYTLTSNQLQNVKLSVKDEDGKTINKPSTFNYSIPDNISMNTYSIGFSEKTAEIDFYITKGTYNFGTSVMSTESQLPERLILQKNVEVGSKKGSMQSIDITSDNLTEVSLDNKSDLKRLLALVSDPETGFLSLLDLKKDSSIKVSKGFYNMELLCDISEYGSSYTYIMSSQKDFSGDKTYISCGKDFSISITPNKSVYKAKETLKSENMICDRFGNRVTRIIGSSLFGFMSDKIKSSKGQLTLVKDQDEFKLYDSAEKEYIEMPYYDIRAPFIYITDSLGDVVYSSKSPVFYTNSQIKLDPKWALSGEYKIKLTIDIDADGDLSGQSSFRIK